LGKRFITWSVARSPTAWLDLEGIEGTLTFAGCPGTVQFCSDGAAIDDVERRVLSLLLLAPLVSPSPEHADRWRKWSSLLTYTVAAARAVGVVGVRGGRGLEQGKRYAEVAVLQGVVQERPASAVGLVRVRAGVDERRADGVYVAVDG
jgi:hypothetical protein